MKRQWKIKSLIALILGFLFAAILLAIAFYGSRKLNDLIITSKVLTLTPSLLGNTNIISDDILQIPATDSKFIEAINSYKISLPTPVSFLNLWNQDLTVVYSDDLEYIGKTIEDHRKLVSDTFQASRIHWHQEGMARGESNSELVATDTLALFIPIQSSDSMVRYVAELHIVISGDMSRLRSQILSVELVVGLTGFAVIVIIWFLSVFLIAKPIQKLQMAARDLASGKFYTVIQPSRISEIVDLVTAFNTMSNQIQTSYMTLEETVGRRTRELEEARKNLQDRMQFTEMQNQTLKANKKAMLNLLEDAKSLEDQLKVEKASIEQRVVERTRELRDQQARLLASIESLTRGFIMTDMEGNILLTNRRVESILGRNLKPWTLEDIAERLVGIFDVHAAFRQCLKENKIIEAKEVQYVVKVLNIMIIPVLAHEKDEKKMIGTLILLKDISEAKILQRSRDEFFSIASHELRTPLTAIRGNAAMVRDFFSDKVPGEVKEMIGDIHESSLRLITIVNDFLDVSRLELGKIQYKNAPVDLPELIGDIFKELGPSTLDKKLELKLASPPENLPKVFGDEDRIKQIAINLVGNSLKFTEKGGITVSISREGDMVRTAVTDTGKGISYQSQALLFRKFQQAAESIHTRDATKGTGLGLYISKLLVEGMGGKISLDKSSEGVGSTFSFTLPIAPLQVVSP